MRGLERFAVGGMVAALALLAVDAALAPRWLVWLGPSRHGAAHMIGTLALRRPALILGIALLIVALGAALVAVSVEFVRLARRVLAGDVSDAGRQRA